MPYILIGPKIRLSPLLPPLLFLLFRSGAPLLSACAAVAIHEAAHAAAGVFLRLEAETVTVSPLGADIRYKGVIPYGAEVTLALAGPAASVLSAFAALFFLREYFSVSLVYGLLNLVPVPCLDGGRALYGILHILAPAEKADALCRAVNVVFLMLLYLFSVFLLFYTSFNASLLFLCAYIFINSYVKMA